MKNRSPSCGVKGVKVYDKKDTHSFSKKKSYGLFSANIIKYYPNHSLEDEGTLKNFKIREDFLTKIFVLSEFRNISNDKKINDLIKFQSKHKYLIMSYSQVQLKKLGNIVANHKKDNIKDVYSEYRKELFETFSKNRKKSNIIYALTHIFGYFKNSNNSNEKNFFLQNIEIYKENRIPLSSIIFILKAWALRDNNEYILIQSLLNPFPEDLIELVQSGKNIDI